MLNTAKQFNVLLDEKIKMLGSAQTELQFPSKETRGEATLSEAHDH